MQNRIFARRWSSKPSLTKIRALLGLCERRLGKTDAARTDLEAVLGELDDPGIRMEVGFELIELDTASQDLARAATVVEALRQKAPTDPRVLYAAYPQSIRISQESRCWGFPWLLRSPDRCIRQSPMSWSGSAI